MFKYLLFFHSCFSLRMHVKSKGRLCMLHNFCKKRKQNAVIPVFCKLIHNADLLLLLDTLLLPFWKTLSHPQDSNVSTRRSSTDLFADVEVEQHHAEVVHDEGFPELKRLAVLHVKGSGPEEEQVEDADPQSRERRRHHRPFLHTLI